MPKVVGNSFIESTIFLAGIKFVLKLIGLRRPFQKVLFQCFILYLAIEYIASTENNANNIVKHTEKMIKNLLKLVINFFMIIK